MANFQAIAWGKTQIRFRPVDLDEKKVREAARLVSPSFENMQDSFVGLTTNSNQIVAEVPVKPKAKIFPVPIKSVTEPGGGIQAAITKALEEAANFLKGRV